MAQWGQVQQQDSKYNPMNRFLFCCCHTDEVDVGWGCGCCGCRAFPFSCGVLIFSAIMLVATIKDIIDIRSNSYVSKTKGYFKTLFYVKIAGDCVCILAALVGLYSLKTVSYCKSIIAYYLGFISFAANSVFCGYALSLVNTFSFWWTIGFTTPVVWGIVEYILLLFDWILFCNMVNMKRKEREFSKYLPYGF